MKPRFAAALAWSVLAAALLFLGYVSSAATIQRPARVRACRRSNREQLVDWPPCKTGHATAASYSSSGSPRSIRPWFLSRVSMVIGDTMK